MERHNMVIHIIHTATLGKDFIFKKSSGKERDIKKWLAGLLTALLLAVFTLPVMASDGIDARLNRQQERINHLSDKGGWPGRR